MCQTHLLIFDQILYHLKYFRCLYPFLTVEIKQILINWSLNIIYWHLYILLTFDPKTYT